MIESQNDVLAELPGEPLCLQFADTTGNSRGTSNYDLLTDAEAFIVWCVRAGVASAAQGQACRGQARRRPAHARRVHARALRLRLAIHRIAATLIAHEEPNGDDFAELNKVLQKALSHMRVVPGNPVHWQMDGSGDPLERLLWPIARSAADLFTSPYVDRLVKCAGQTCDWLFLDNTKNHSRRFCKSSGCGNRERVRRFYRRARATKARRS